MRQRRTLILGAGYSGAAYGRLLAEKGLAVAGTTRSPQKAATLSAKGIAPLIFDGAQMSADLEAVIADVTDIIVSIAPDAEGDPVLKALGQTIAQAPNLQWLAYLSTVGVYGNHDGAWVDEETACRPVSQRSIQRVSAETAWQACAETINCPLSILRLSGIYGPGRNALVTLSEGRARRLVKPGQVFNRIHVHDIAAALDFLATGRHHGLWNVTDDLPAPPQDVVAYAASVMKVDPPPEIDFETATLSPMARSFYGENKRVSNRKIKDAGFAFQHDTYQTALDSMWADGSWRKPDEKQA